MKAIRLKYLAHINAGQSPAGEDVNDLGVGLPFLQGCAEFGQNHPDPKKFCVTPPKVASPGSWLFSVRAPVGALNRADQSYGIGRGLAAVTARAMDRNYLGYFLEYISPQLAAIGSGSTYGAISAADLGDVLVPVLEIDEQREIADFLDRETSRIDNLLQAKERLNTCLEAKRKSSITQALFGGDVRFEWNANKQAFGFQFSKKDWSELRVKHVVTFMTSGSRGWSDFLSSEGDLFIQSGNIGTDMNLDLSEANRITRQEGAEADRTVVNVDDVLLCITGGRTGAVGYVREIDERAHVNQHVCLLRARADTIMPKLLAYLLWSEFGQAQIGAMQYGMKQGLGFSEVGEIRMPVPPRPQQPDIVQRIERSMNVIDNARSRLTTSISKLLELRSSLMTAAVIGQIDVKTWRHGGQADRNIDQQEAKVMA